MARKPKSPKSHRAGTDLDIDDVYRQQVDDEQLIKEQLESTDGLIDSLIALRALLATTAKPDPVDDEKYREIVRSSLNTMAVVAKVYNVCFLCLVKSMGKAVSDGETSGMIQHGEDYSIEIRPLPGGLH